MNLSKEPELRHHLLGEPGVGGHANHIVVMFRGTGPRVNRAWRRWHLEAFRRRFEGWIDDRARKQSRAVTGAGPMPMYRLLSPRSRRHDLRCMQLTLLRMLWARCAPETWAQQTGDLWKNRKCLASWSGSWLGTSNFPALGEKLAVSPAFACFMLRDQELTPALSRVRVGRPMSTCMAMA